MYYFSNNIEKYNREIDTKLKLLEIISFLE